MALIWVTVTFLRTPFLLPPHLSCSPFALRSALATAIPSLMRSPITSRLYSAALARSRANFRPAAPIGRCLRSMTLVRRFVLATRRTTSRAATWCALAGLISKRQSHSLGQLAFWPATNSNLVNPWSYLRTCRDTTLLSCLSRQASA